MNTDEAWGWEYEGLDGGFYMNIRINKTEVESVQLGNTYIADMDKCPWDKCCLDKCRGDSCNLLYIFPGPFV